jgi:hypothetical protein
MPFMKVKSESMAEVLHRLGDIPLERILASPAPGTATEDDAIACLDGAYKQLVELVDGVLVEKVMGIKESLLAQWIGHQIWTYLEEHDHGLLFGADGPLRLAQGLIRLPDVSFVSWDQMPDGLPDVSVLTAFPDLAVEVVSWVIYPKTESAEVYSLPDRKKRVGKAGVLDGGEVLPGFTLPLKAVFDKVKRLTRKSG